MPIVEKRRFRRNPAGAFAKMVKASSKLEEAQLFSRRVSGGGKTLLKAAMESALAKAAVRRQLLLDAKFNIENDAAFNERLFRFVRSAKARRPFSFAILDLDNLRLLNKAGGYAAADRAIALFAEKASGIAKKHGGFAGRFGGDELKILVPKEPRFLADSLNKALAEMIKNGASFSGGITSSEGLSGLPLQQVVERLNEKANVALNASKRKKARMSFF
ncbi:MAG: GGDEF domain-containing protein [Candidatus Diapherotrites archaeon]|nr:GGDEF domain-containing protein [Candidatus Diapherotrites archaeon]